MNKFKICLAISFCMLLLFSVEGLGASNPFDSYNREIAKVKKSLERARGKRKTKLENTLKALEAQKAKLLEKYKAPVTKKIQQAEALMKKANPQQKKQLQQKIAKMKAYLARVEKAASGQTDSK